MQYLGIDWAYRRAAFCARSESGAIIAEGFVPADEDGLARLVLDHGTEVKACVEMMSGAVWVRDQLAAAAGRCRSRTRVRSEMSLRWPARPTRSTRVCSPSCAGATSCPSCGCRRWRTGRCASAAAAHPSRPPAGVGAEPDLRAADAVGPAPLGQAVARAGRDGVARGARRRGDLATLDCRSARSHRPSRRQHRAVRGRAARARPTDRASPCCARSRASVTCSA